jgi:hypothetical protein
MDEDGLTNILHDIISVQSYQVHQFRNYLGPLDLLPTEGPAEESTTEGTTAALGGSTAAPGGSTAAPTAPPTESESFAMSLSFAFIGLALIV